MVGVVGLPEKILSNINKKIPFQWKTCFYAALITGLLAHLYKITNWMPNWDSLVFRYDSQNMIELGRWFLPVVCSISSFYDLPFLNGMLTIIIHGLGAVCICRMFEVKKNITAGLIGAVLVSFPAVTSVMMYNYVADGYSISFLLSCMAAMYMTGEKPKYIISAVLITLSVAIYQAYITVTVMLILLYLADELIYKKKDTVYLIKKSLKLMLTGLLGLILYYILLIAFLKLSGKGLLEYQGMESGVSLSNLDIWASLYIIKHSFLNFFFDFSSGVNIFAIINCILFTLMLVWYFSEAVKYSVFSSLSKGLLLIIIAVMIPAGSAILAFINPGVDYHTLMKMGYSVFYIWFIMLYERNEEEYSSEKMHKSVLYSKKCSAVKAWSVFAVSLLLITNQVVVSNISYHKSQIAYEKSYGILIRIADRIEQTEGSGKCSKILVIGALSDSEAYSAKLPLEITGTTDGYILRQDDEVVGQSVLCSALNDYCGKNYEFLFGEEKKKLLGTEEVKNMESWPSKDSVRVKGDVVIIKLGTESE